MSGPTYGQSLWSNHSERLRCSLSWSKLLVTALRLSAIRPCPSSMAFLISLSLFLKTRKALLWASTLKIGRPEVSDSRRSARSASELRLIQTKAEGGAQLSFEFPYDALESLHPMLFEMRQNRLLKMLAADDGIARRAGIWRRGRPQGCERGAYWPDHHQRFQWWN